MPFTPFHLGPALALGVFLRRRVHLPTLLVASIAVDVEPLIALMFHLQYPLHGYLHTLLLASIFGIVIGLLMRYLDNNLKTLYNLFRLGRSGFAESGLGGFVLGGLLGTITHVLLDAPLYCDIKPFYPFTLNPLYDLATNSGCFKMIGVEITVMCVFSGLAGLAGYIRHSFGRSPALVYSSMVLFLLSLASLTHNQLFSVPLLLVTIINICALLIRTRCVLDRVTFYMSLILIAMPFIYASLRTYSSSQAPCLMLATVMDNTTIMLSLIAIQIISLK